MCNITSAGKSLMETLRDDSSVASERIIVGVSKFHSWGKYTMPFTNINSDWMYFL